MIRLPASLAKRPRKKGLPIPVVNEHPQTDGTVTVDFTAINGEAAVALSKRRKCGLCGQHMVGAVAFLGGPLSARYGSYSDPPMHPACARAAIQLCPHINSQKTHRVKNTKVESETPDNFVLEKPEYWVLVTTNEYRMIRQSGHVVYMVDKAIKREHYTYNEEGKIQHG